MSGAWLAPGRLRSVAHDKPAVHRFQHGDPPHRRFRPTQNSKDRFGYRHQLDVGVRALVLLLLAVNFVLWLQSRSRAGQSLLADLQEPLHETSEVPIASPKYLYLAIPSLTDHDVDLCKTILTAQILNYPVPDLIRWGQGHTGEHVADTQSAQAKLSSIQSWFRTLPQQADDGIVILLSGPDLWFQLRPEVLLRRYYDNVRARSEETGQPAERVVFAAEKRCQHSANMPSYDSCTSQTSEDSSLSDSIIMGPIHEVRSLIDTAVQMASEKDWRDSLAVFVAIHALQEANGATSEQMPFRIGLDIHQSLSLSANHALEARKHGHLKQDIRASMSPFWTPGGQEPDLPHDLSWEEVRLLGETGDVLHGLPASIFFGTNNSAQTYESRYGTTTPANAYADPREDLWPYLWLQPYARILYTAAALTPTTIIALVEDNQGELIRFWAEERLNEKAGMHDRLLRSFRPWDVLCQGKEESQAIFLDLQGDWEVP